MKFLLKSNDQAQLPDSQYEELLKNYNQIREKLRDLLPSRDKSASNFAQDPKLSANEPFPPNYALDSLSKSRSTKSQHQKQSCTCLSNSSTKETKYLVNEADLVSKCIVHGGFETDFSTSGVNLVPTDQLGRLISYKDFDVLLPSDNFNQIYSSMDSSIYNSMPKAYEFLNQGLDFTRYTDQDAIRELETFLNRLKSSLSSDRIDWQAVGRTYSSPEQRERVDLIKKFVNGLISEQRSANSGIKENDSLNKLDEYVSRVLSPESSGEYILIAFF